MKKYQPLLQGTSIVLAIGIASVFISEMSTLDIVEILTKSSAGIHKLLNTIILSSATILTLLLTYIGISANKNSQLKESRFKGIDVLARTVVLLFCGALIFFYLLNSPLTESIQMWNADTRYYYYLFIIFYLNLLCGVLLSSILMIYTLIKDVLKEVNESES